MFKIDGLHKKTLYTLIYTSTWHIIVACLLKLFYNYFKLLEYNTVCVLLSHFVLLFLQVCLK